MAHSKKSARPVPGECVRWWEGEASIKLKVRDMDLGREQSYLKSRRVQC